MSRRRSSIGLAEQWIGPLRMAFAGQKVGVMQVTDEIWLVSFMHYDLGTGASSR